MKMLVQCHESGDATGGSDTRATRPATNTSDYLSALQHRDVANEVHQVHRRVRVGHRVLHAVDVERQRRVPQRWVNGCGGGSGGRRCHRHRRRRHRADGRVPTNDAAGRVRGRTVRGGDQSDLQRRDVHNKATKAGSRASIALWAAPQRRRQEALVHAHTQNAEGPSQPPATQVCHAGSHTWRGDTATTQRY